MSWAISKVLNNESNEVTDMFIQSGVDALRAIDRTHIGNQQCEKERDEQIDAAIKAVGTLLAQGGFANAAGLSVTLSGHANPEHKSQPGWANEAINISLSITRYQEGKL